MGVFCCGRERGLVKHSPPAKETAVFLDGHTIEAFTFAFDCFFRNVFYLLSSIPFEYVRLFLIAFHDHVKNARFLSSFCRQLSRARQARFVKFVLPIQLFICYFVRSTCRVLRLSCNYMYPNCLVQCCRFYHSVRVQPLAYRF